MQTYVHVVYSVLQVLVQHQKSQNAENQPQICWFLFFANVEYFPLLVC